MTVLTSAREAMWPGHLLTLAEWDGLPEELYRRSELVEGVLLVVPSPAALHQIAATSLCVELNRQLPDTYFAVADLDIELEASPLPTVRKPDVVVVRKEPLRANPNRLAAADVVLAVEIVSPGSGRTDRVMKLAEYAAAGILSYWIIELGPPVTVSAFELVDQAYQLAGEGPGPLAVDAPAALRIDLAALVKF